MSSNVARFAPFLLWLVLVALVAALYLPALSAPTQFDTDANLKGLVELRQGSAATFALTGEAGPSGRPLALLTFALQSSDWPDNPQALRIVNLLIHLVNAAMLYLFAFLIAGYGGIRRREAHWVGVIASLIWAGAPLLASTNLFLIQRMTSLCALFVVMGIVCHLFLRTRGAASSTSGLLVLSFNLLLFTGFAALSKENGLLLPSLILVVELTVLRGLNSKLDPSVLWAAWKGVFLLLPTIAIVYFVLSRLPYSALTVEFRGFDGFERLITQSVILWQYLLNFVVPAEYRLGIFHDAYGPFRNIFDPIVLLSIFVWLALLGLAISSARKQPVLSFGILWFLAAHFLESTVILLELYFEHRNYLPLMGPAIAIAFYAVKVPSEYRKLMIMGLSMHFLLCMLVLFQVTQNWAHPLRGAEAWAKNNPTSLRAALNLTTRLIENDDTLTALMVVRQSEAFERHQALAYMVDMSFNCHFGLGWVEQDVVGAFVERLDQSQFTFATVSYFNTMQEVRSMSECTVFDSEDLILMAKSLLEHDQFGKFPYTQRRVNAFVGRELLANRGYEAAFDYLQRSLLVTRDPQVLFYAVVSLLESDQLERGCGFLEDMRALAPKRLIARRIWLESLDVYEQDFELRLDGLSCRAAWSGA